MLGLVVLAFLSLVAFPPSHVPTLSCPHPPMQGYDGAAGSRGPPGDQGAVVRHNYPCFLCALLLVCMCVFRELLVMLDHQEKMELMVKWYALAYNMLMHTHTHTHTHTHNVHTPNMMLA